eukprot:TRINITY_DN12215_c0_g1_i1.p1 TRINITY_DN12215_c0_g1~~TRINITY_DN12215_c0_g1_i1.p1  ORF type:complete len:253 (-),score=77.46 TRINITY_DN12215_c0_g1_i1:32-790(-)
MYIEDLYREGYLMQEKEKLIIRFYVRAPLFSQQAKDQEKYIRKLEEKIRTMQKTIDNYKEIYAKEGVGVDTKNEQDANIKQPEEDKAIIPPEQAEIKKTVNPDKTEDPLKPEGPSKAKPIDENNPNILETDIQTNIQNINAEEEVKGNFAEDIKESREDVKEAFDVSANKANSPVPESGAKILGEISNKCLSELKPERQVAVNTGRIMYNPAKKISVSATATPDKKHSDKQLNNSNDVCKSKELDETANVNN